MRIRYCLLLVPPLFLLIRYLMSTDAPLIFCKITETGIDPFVFGYLCTVQICMMRFVRDTKDDKFEDMWKKIPHNAMWCSTNAQMSTARFTTRNELTIFNVKNMLVGKQKEEKCIASVVSLENDRTITDLELEKSFPYCKFKNFDFRKPKLGTISHALNRFKKPIDFLVIGPSQSSSRLLFQKFLNINEGFYPTICQINFAFTMPQFKEEHGFRELFSKFLTESKYILMGASKDRNHMHMNLFFVNMREPYCRERYLRYFSYY